MTDALPVPPPVPPPLPPREPNLWRQSGVVLFIGSSILTIPWWSVIARQRSPELPAVQQQEPPPSLPRDVVEEAAKSFVQKQIEGTAQFDNLNAFLHESTDVSVSWIVSGFVESPAGGAVRRQSFVCRMSYRAGGVSLDALQIGDRRYVGQEHLLSSETSLAEDSRKVKVFERQKVPHNLQSEHFSLAGREFRVLYLVAPHSTDRPYEAIIELCNAQSGDRLTIFRGRIVDSESGRTTDGIPLLAEPAFTGPPGRYFLEARGLVNANWSVVVWDVY